MTDIKKKVSYCVYNKSIREFTFGFNADGIAVDLTGRIGLGAVLILRNQESQTFMMVKKREKEDYEFSNNWVFPGGMTRLGAEMSAPGEAIVKECLAVRVLSEAAIRTDMTAWRRFDPPVMSRYTAKGAVRHTLVLAYFCNLSQSIDSVEDVALPPSIQDRAWKSPHEVFEEIAPANRVLAGRILWPELSTTERLVKSSSLEEATGLCSQWAEEVQLDLPAWTSRSSDC